MKMECPAQITIGAAADGQSLSVRMMDTNHNHPLDEHAFRHSSRQRKLDLETRYEAKSMLQLDANPTRIRQYLSGKT